MSVSALLPMALPSCANLREHWAVRAKRVKGQRLAATFALRAMVGDVRAELQAGARLVVTLTRVAPRQLDDDNLASAFKGVRDGVADVLGIDDRDTRVAWRYEQEKGAPKQAAVGIRIDVRQPQHEVCW